LSEVRAQRGQHARSRLADLPHRRRLVEAEPELRLPAVMLHGKHQEIGLVTTLRDVDVEILVLRALNARRP